MFKQNKRLAPKRKNKYVEKRDKSYTFLTLAILALFVGVILCIWLYSYTLISFFNFSKILIGFAVVGFLVPLKYYHKWLNFIKYETIIFNVVGVAPLFTSLFLLTNFMFTTTPFTHQYRIEKIYFSGEENYKSTGVILENNYFSGEPKIIKLRNNDLQDLMGKSHFKITLAKGFFGFEVIKDREFVK